jgi:hypothetical protein
VLRRTLLLTLAVASLIGVALPVAAAASKPHRAWLQRFVCRPAANPLNRLLEDTAVMRPLPGTTLMELRFVLLQRRPGRGFREVYGGDLGQWRQLPVEFPTNAWVLHKPVVNLPAPAVYQFRVTFRWLASSSVIATQTRLSPLCRQPR